ncbi:MAG: hypothetical protein GXP54_00430, partial [Deltaproteobacteria bacterium]|nr:hypothetical protein [Deltaproteobacteria bacterium]
MKKGLFTLMFTCLLVATQAAASPQSAWYSDESDRMFWFMVITDSHIGCGKSCTNDLKWATGEAYQVIKPQFVFNCGDLVDATNGGLIPSAQYDQEWSAYRAILDENGMTPLNYIDMPGNHDAYFDKGLTHFLEWSIQGSLDGNTQHSVTFDDWYGKYHFLAVATSTMNGGSWWADNAALDDAEMQFIEASFQQNADADLHFAFGHHGIHWGGSNKVGEGGVKFESLMKSNQVSAYFWGHTHDYLSEFHNGTLFRNTRSLGKSGDLNFTLAAVDHNAVEVRTFDVDDWPYLLITAPTDAQLGGGNPYTYPVPNGWTQAPVRALVFSKSQPESVVFRIDGGNWAPMEQVAESTWQGLFDATQLAAGTHKARVRANPWTDSDQEIAFFVASVACSNGIDDDQDGLTDFPD